MKLTIEHFNLQLKHEFRISRGTVSMQPTLIVELEEYGLKGYGETTTNTYYGHTLESMTRHLESNRKAIETTHWSDPVELWEALEPLFEDNRFAQCALDQAAHDLWGKRNSRPVWDLWDLDVTGKLPVSNYTIGLDSMKTMCEKMAEFPDWPIYKIKLGTPDDLEIVRMLRQHTDAKFRVDANCAWSAKKTVELSDSLKELDVEFIEQPLDPHDHMGMAEIAKCCALPIIADESCQTESDVGDCFHFGFDGINIKLCKCGGLTPARRMISKARELGLSVMVGCMTESTVGISAIAQLLPLIDYVDMDGAVLLAKDIATGVRLDKGRCIFPDLPGLGVELIA